MSSNVCNSDGFCDVTAAAKSLANSFAGNLSQPGAEMLESVMKLPANEIWLLVATLLKKLPLDGSGEVPLLPTEDNKSTD